MIYCRRYIENYMRSFDGLRSCQGHLPNGTCSSVDVYEPRAFGEYQYYQSFGGDQYYNMPLVMENVFGVLGIVIHVSHFIAGLVFELTGYTTFGNF